MTPEQFVYWLQGYFELSDDTDRLSKREHIIRDHLKEVFEKRTPDRSSGTVTITPTVPYMPSGDGGSGTYFPSTSPTVIC